MKTTVEIDDSIISEAREVAKKEGTTLRDLVESGLRKELTERKRASSSKPYKLPDRRHSARIMLGIDLRDWRQLQENIV